ncbi:MAG: hypothetical protein ACI93T_001917 [Porticoccaceae bacterium]|jgi:hypothetical protein
MNDDTSPSAHNDDVVRPDAADNDSAKHDVSVPPSDLLDSTFQVAKRLSIEERRNVERFPFRLNCLIVMSRSS